MPNYIYAPAGVLTLFFCFNSIPVIITSNHGVAKWAGGSLADCRALYSRIYECHMVKPLFDEAPTDANKIAALKREYGIPPNETDWCLVKEGYDYSGEAGGAALLMLYKMHFNNPITDIKPLGPSDVIQEIPWQLPQEYREFAF